MTAAGASAVMVTATVAAAMPEVPASPVPPAGHRSREWLALAAAGAQAAAIERLHDLLLRALAAARRRPGLPHLRGGNELDDIARRPTTR